MLTLSLGGLSACDSFVEPQRATPEAPSSLRAAAPQRPQPPKLTVQTPRYPAAVIYILYREYLHKNPGLTSLSPDDPKYQRYLERRLHQLYPGKGYNGMVKDAIEENRQHQLAWAEYQRQAHQWKLDFGIMCNNGELIDPVTGENCTGGGGGDGTTTPDPAVDSSWDGNEEHLVPPDETIPSIAMEIDTLQMSSVEVNEIYYQESLADGSFFTRTDEVIVTTTGARATLDDLIRAAGDGWSPPSSPSGGNDSTVTIQVNPLVIAATLVGLAVPGWKAWRLKQAADRAEQKSAAFFPQESAGTQRDAHRHIFFNMQGRRYVGSYLIKQLSDNHENDGNNPPAHYVMDLHNNDIGREHRYKSFRGHWLWDRWDWQEWAEKVRNYINYPPNAEYISEWTNSPPSTRSEAAAREALVPDAKYIYFVP